MIPVVDEGMVDNLDELVQSLAEADEMYILRTATRALLMERCAYVLRGACAYELLRRTAPLAGGRGLRDLDGQGRKAALARLAGETGRSVATLYDDARIYATFFRGKTGLVAETTFLGREHYRLALRAPDPKRAVRWACQLHGGDRPASCRELKEYLRKLSARRSVRHIRVSISEDAFRALRALVSACSSSRSRVVERLILDAFALMSGDISRPSGSRAGKMPDRPPREEATTIQ